MKDSIMSAITLEHVAVIASIYIVCYCVAHLRGD